MTVQPKLAGRLGNFMFQVAAAYAYSLEHNMPYSVPPIAGGVVPGTIERYLSWFPHVKVANPLTNAFVYEEPTHAYRPIPVVTDRDLQIVGYFQSEKYFSKYREEVKKLFRFDYAWPIDPAVSIHIRRGDYVQYAANFPPVDEQYLRPAIDSFTLRGYEDFLVFSDDIEWCQTHFSRYKGNFSFSEGLTEIEDMHLMSMCQHNIICNSTFSWWAAWMNPNPDKIVVTPSEKPGNWFGRKVALDTSTILPPEWERIEF